MEINCFDTDDHLFFAAMEVQLAHLRTLDVIARHGSFSRAARELHLTQPAVSMQVRQLERGLGLPLLERVGKRAFPTRAGEVLLAHAARAFRDYRRSSRRNPVAPASCATGDRGRPNDRARSVPTAHRKHETAPDTSSADQSRAA